MAYELMAGTITEFTEDGGTTWKELPKLKEVPEFGVDGSFIDVTGLKDTVNEYTGGRMDTPDASLRIIDTGVTAEQDLLAAADLRKTIDIRYTLPSTTVFTVTYALSGYKSDPSGDVLEHVINAKQSGKPVKG
ncbi:phage tail tube protein [Thiomicrorhabdus lithotrophica]|uniref:Phage tail tube protein n=1 Tax=Thiomicrorhabdus lithotrophica TaxID=2949997 RepID=A0ABY8C863_9GAMM|nr:phage tail tube protein [Thiomicrorhabdus lithotrophica]WEJ62154.1 hypothetical protein NR989_09050 [Thiomicrorhabdus lithotrophica]